MNPPREHFAGTGPAASTHPSTSRAYAEFVESIDPGCLARAGITDADIDAPPKSLAESVEAGWITAAEKRQIEGTATEADLIEGGYSPAEVLEILAEQQDRACASST
jgi:hypothetical protein